MLELLYATGPACPKLVGLTPADVNIPDGYLTTMGKGRKARMVPMGQEAARWLERYLRDGRPALLGGGSPRLFVNARGGTTLTRIGFWKVIRGYATGLGWPGG